MSLQSELACRRALFDQGAVIPPLDAENWRLLGELIEIEVDLRLERLAEIKPAPGFDTLRRSDQERYDTRLADLDAWRALRGQWVDVELRGLEAGLDNSAACADLAMQAFNRELEQLR